MPAADIPSSQIQPHTLIRTAHVPPSLSRCILDPDRSAFDSSLRRGPDRAELRARARARQPRDLEEIWSLTTAQRIHYGVTGAIGQSVDALGAGLDVFVDEVTRVAVAAVAAELTSRPSRVHVASIYSRLSRRDGHQAVLNLGAWRNVNESAKVNFVRRMVAVSRPFGALCRVALVRPRQVVPLY